MNQPTRAWRKSSRSNGSGGACVEVAVFIDGTIGVRDSKNPTGPALALDPTEWTRFIDAARHGVFDA